MNKPNLKCSLLEKLCINKGGIRFKDIRMFIISSLIPHIFWLLPRLPDMVQKCFCIPGGTMDPTFRNKYIPSSFVFNLMVILIIKQIPFFLAPCIVRSHRSSYRGGALLKKFPLNRAKCHIKLIMPYISLGRTIWIGK